MITKEVNGKLVQVFLFGEFETYAPVKLGAGYRKQLESAKTKDLISTEAWSETLESLSKARNKPKGLPNDAWIQQLTEEAVPILMSRIDLTEAWKSDLAILNVLLTPAPGAPSIEELYKEHATEEQVQAVVNFSNGLVESKTETESLPDTSGKDTKASKAARSHATSRQPSEV